MSVVKPEEKYMQIYVDETGTGAINLMCHVHAPTFEYVQWLESRLLKSESTEKADNKPMPFALQIFGEVAVVVPLDYLPYNIMAVSKKLYDELAASGDIVATKTSA